MINTKVRSIFRSPTAAVVTAYALRMGLLWLSLAKEAALQKLRVLGLEEGRVAWSLATGKGFFGPFPGYEALTAWVAPVYPFLWAVCLKASHLNSEAMILFAQTMNCTFSAATCWPIYSIGKRLFGEKTGVASAWMWMIMPLAILMPLEWTWDQSLAALILAIIVDVTLRLRDSASSLGWTGYGLLWGLAALVNPALCAVLPFLAAWLIYERRRLARASIGLYARAAALFVLALAPWTIRNYYAIDGWVFVKSNFGLELWLGNHPGSVTAELHPMNSFSERMRLIFEGEANYSKEKQRMAVAYIRSHPGEFLSKSWNRFLDTWSARDDSGVDGWIAGLHLIWESVWFCSVFSLLALLGLALGLRTRGFDSLPLATCLVAFPILYYITHTALRYRHPIDPIMTICCAFALSQMWSALFPNRSESSLVTITNPKLDNSEHVPVHQS